MATRILIESRILTVIDVLDAMMSERPHRPAPMRTHRQRQVPAAHAGRERSTPFAIVGWRGPERSSLKGLLMIKRVGMLAALVGIVTVVFRSFRKMMGGSDTEETVEG